MTFRIKKSLLGIAAVSLLAPVAGHAQVAGKGPWINDGFTNATRDGRGSTCVSAGGADHAFDNAACTGAAAEAQAATNSEAAAAKAAAAEKSAAAAAAREEALMAVEPGSGLKPGEKGYYARDPAGNAIRDGLGRNCVRDSRWSVAHATEECDPELFETWRNRQGAGATGELAPRLQSEPPLRQRTAMDDVDRSPGVAPAAAATAAAAAPVTGDNTNQFPVTTYDGGEAAVGAAAVGATALAAGIPDDDRPMPEDEYDEPVAAEDAIDDDDTVAMLADDDGIPDDDKAMPEDDPEEAAKAEDDADDDDTVAMLADDDGIPDDDKAMPEDDPEEAAKAEDDGEDDDTVAMADEMLDRSPGVAPVAAPAAAAAAVTGDNTGKFPVTTYETEKEVPKKPTALPVTIQVQRDGLFDFDRADLRSDLIVKLDGVVDMLKDAKYDKVSVVGHADPIGTAAYNQKLSERRAEAVRKYLVNKGIDPARIITSGKGESDLVVTRADCHGKRKKALIECLEPNRRVVIDAAGEKPAR
jgi:outer membrane protein OmpA-like peptidoglycan-associated protein